MQFSANLGFLWTELSLPDAIDAAKLAGFDAVECHWPYDTDPAEVAEALARTGLPMLGLNTARGDTDAGENGLCALPGRQKDARATINQAVRYAMATGTRNIHVMAGCAEGGAAHAAFVENLTYACALAAPQGITILIEPLNPHDAPGYFLRSTGQALEIIAQVDADNLKLMFDCYHVQRIEGDLSHRLGALQAHIGHIQFASVPDRAAPDHGEVDYAHLFGVIAQMGYEGPLGAEYKPGGPTEPTLGWLMKHGG